MTIEERIACVLWKFDWGNYGLNNVELGILDDPDAQEWIPDLSKEIAAALHDAG
jgi:hypothetical protein